MTQTDRILAYMRDFGSITPLQAFSDIGCMRLAARISDLKKAGHEIRSETVATTNRYGETCHVTRYSLAE